MMAALLVQAAAAGFAPESNVCADEVAAGRPAPWMAITAAMQLGVQPVGIQIDARTLRPHVKRNGLVIAHFLEAAGQDVFRCAAASGRTASPQAIFACSHR